MKPRWAGHKRTVSAANKIRTKKKQIRLVERTSADNLSPGGPGRRSSIKSNFPIQKTPWDQSAEGRRNQKANCLAQKPGFGGRHSGQNPLSRTVQGTRRGDCRPLPVVPQASPLWTQRAKINAQAALKSRESAGQGVLLGEKKERGYQNRVSRVQHHGSHVVRLHEPNTRHGLGCRNEKWALPRAGRKGGRLGG